MDAIYIYPEDINSTEWSESWIKLCEKLGQPTPSGYILVIPITVKN